LRLCAFAPLRERFFSVELLFVQSWLKLANAFSVIANTCGVKNQTEFAALNNNFLFSGAEFSSVC
jgi:hypothetical protein